VKTSFKLENGLLGTPKWTPKLVVLILFYTIVSTNKIIIKTIPLSVKVKLSFWNTL